MLAAPSAAQTAVTSSGREGPTACLSQEEINAGNMPITALSTTSVTYTAPAITWNEYVGRLGDVPAPANARIIFTVYNVDAGGTKPFFINLNSGGQANALSRNETGLSAKTLYYVDAVVHAVGADNNIISNIPTQVFARRCFMTGGTYTMNAAPGTGAQGHENNFNSGCFSISPLTQQHVRNCWCGRKNTLPLFSLPQNNTDFLNMWGCR